MLERFSLAELVLGGLLLLVCLLQVFALWRQARAARMLQDEIGLQLAEQLEQQLNVQHREVLRDLHDGLGRQTDRIGEHARADRELLQRGLSSASAQLARSIDSFTRSVDGRLETLAGHVNQRLDEGFRKTNETFASVMARLATPLRLCLQAVAKSL